MAKIKVKIAITPKANNLPMYEILDLITVNGRSYLSRKNLNSAPVTDESSWMKVTENNYDSAVRHGYIGTEEEWLSSILASEASEEIRQLMTELEEAEAIRQASEEARIIAEQERSHDIYNITAKKPLPEGVYYTIVDEHSEYYAPNIIPSIARKNGLFLTLEVAADTWETYQFTGSVTYDFLDRAHWKRDSAYTQSEIEALLENSKLDQFVVLLAVTDTAPQYCIIGDKYYDTASNLIYTAAEIDRWPETGISPQTGKLYASIEDSQLWYCKLDNKLHPFYSKINGGIY